MTAGFSIGLVEVSGLGDAIIMLDDMCKAADVEFVATERRLGGRLVTIVVKGEVSAVKSAVDAGVERAKSCGTYKASRVIPRPHKEVLPYLHLDEKKEVEPKSESAGTHVGPVQEDNEKPKPARRRGRPRKSTAGEAK